MKVSGQLQITTVSSKTERVSPPSPPPTSCTYYTGYRMYSVLRSNSLEERKILLTTSTFIRRPAGDLVTVPPELCQLSNPQGKMYIANMRAEVSTAMKLWSSMLRHRCVWYVFTNFWRNIIFPSSGRNVAEGECLLNFITVYLTTWTQNLEANSLHKVLTYLFTDLLTPWSTVLLEKITGFHLVKISPTFYGTRRFIIAFTSACHLSLSWSSSIQSMPPHHTALSSILILPPYLRLYLTYWGGKWVEDVRK